MEAKVLRKMRWPLLVALCLMAIAGITGCSKLLPRSQEVTLSEWDSFDEIKTAYDQIQSGNTVADLVELGFDLENAPNVQLLNYIELGSLFQTTPLTGLAPGIQRCLNKPDTCRAYVYDLQRLHSKRVGNFWADFLHFHRKTDTSGWRFKMLLVLSHEKVVYKLWSGTSAIETCREETSPLGPLQGAGDRLLNYAY